MKKILKVELTQKEIDRLYFDLKDYVKTLYYVDKLTELSESDKKELKFSIQRICPKEDFREQENAQIWKLPRVAVVHILGGGGHLSI